MQREPAKASFVPLSPMSFLRRAVSFFGERTAVIYGDIQYNYRELGSRIDRLAGALSRLGVCSGDTVAILAPNIPAMLEAHYAVPLTGAVINPINVRLDGESIARFFIAENPKLLICDQEFLELGLNASTLAGVDIPIIVVNDVEIGITASHDFLDYEQIIQESPDMFEAPSIEDERLPLALLNTSGTTGTPKAVRYTHRGTHIAALSNALSFGLTAESIFLWTWPMFHSNGLGFIWSLTAVCGTHVCVRSIDAETINRLIAAHRVSHFCAAPLVLNLLAADPVLRDAKITHAVNCITGGSSPPPNILATLEEMGMTVTHQYGASECYGPATRAIPQSGWSDLEPTERHAMMARQGLPTHAVEDLMVANSVDMQPVPRDGKTTGEIMVRGNAVVDGYHGNGAISSDQFAGGWYHSGDIAIWHKDGSIEIKDRSTDMIISGGENIFSAEIEDVLHRHPEVSEVAVVAKPDKELFQTPLAFIDRVAGAATSASELEIYCRRFLDDAKIPIDFVFCSLPKTATGKIRKYELREIAITHNA